MDIILLVETFLPINNFFDASNAIERMFLIFVIQLHYFVVTHCKKQNPTRKCDTVIIGYQPIKPSAHSRVLSLRHAIFFSSCCKQHFYRCYKQFLKRFSVSLSPGAEWELYFRPILNSSIGLASHVVHETPTQQIFDFGLL